MGNSKKILSALLALSLCGAGLYFSGNASTALSAAEDITRRAAYLSAGIPLNKGAVSNGKMLNKEFSAAEPSQDSGETPASQENSSYIEETKEIEPEPETKETEENNENTPEESLTARVIRQNITDYDDELDYTAAGTVSGAIYRQQIKPSQTPEYIFLESGAAVRNCTEDSADKLLKASQELPEFKIQFNSPEPQVLIMHTHTTESYEPYTRDYYDDNFPFRTRDSEHNMIAVGEVLANILASKGISVLHDGTIHDYPAYSGAYDRSEKTVIAALDQYPSIKVVIDLHRDAIINEDGSRLAPAAEINGKSAAQFMIITGCDDGRFNMPNYMENFKFACLVQNSTEKLYSGLARPLLFDYRNYNQHLTTGSILIEVGGHANSLDEALYTGELLGECIADALENLKE